MVFVGGREMGAARVGDLTYLTSIAQPRIGVVLMGGNAHVETFVAGAGSGATAGSDPLDVVAEAKPELVKALPSSAAGGVAVLNVDDPWVAAMVAHTDAHLIWFGLASRERPIVPQVSSSHARRAARSASSASSDFLSPDVAGGSASDGPRRPEPAGRGGGGSAYGSGPGTVRWASRASRPGAVGMDLVGPRLSRSAVSTCGFVLPRRSIRAKGSSSNAAAVR
jgi:hypothetical protein